MTTAQRRHLLILPFALSIIGVCVVIARVPRVESAAAPIDGDTPEACVARLLSAEQRGDPRACLDCFTFSQRAKFEVVWQGRSQARIAAELQNQSAGLVGCAVTDVSFADPGHAGLVLERIHKDHTRRQQVALVCDKGRWLVADLAEPQHQTPAIPYGTPVFAPR
jgi:hypothetical protein